MNERQEDTASDRGPEMQSLKQRWREMHGRSKESEAQKS